MTTRDRRDVLQANPPRVRLSMKWACISGHEHDTYEQAEACILASSREHQVDPYEVTR